MALKELNQNARYVKWDGIEPGTKVGCFYLESVESEIYKGNLTHYVETIPEEEGEEAERLGLSGCGALDKLIAQVRPGWYIEVEYTGKMALTKGAFKGKDCHTFKVAADEERVHPRFSGDASARKPVEYKKEETAAPLLAPPEQPAAAAAPPAAAAAEPPKKRKAFN